MQFGIKIQLIIMAFIWASGILLASDNRVWVSGAQPNSLGQVLTITITPSTGTGNQTPSTVQTPESGPASSIITSTPASDGSIYHVVEPGQNAWIVAVVYNINYYQLLTQNGLSETSLLYPGDRLVIREAGVEDVDNTENLTVTPLSTFTPTITPEPVYTKVYSGTTVRVRIANPGDLQQQEFVRFYQENDEPIQGSRFWFVSGIALVALLSVLILSRRK
jgi:hypothetical protein